MRNVVDVIGQILDRRRRVEQDLVPQTVLGRHPDGTLRLRPQDGECELRGGVGGEESGQVIQRPPAPVFTSRGLGGNGTARRSGGQRTIWVERLEPRDLPRGQVTTVIVHGLGFTASTQLEFGDLGTRQLNPDLTIQTQTLLDAKRIELQVEVAVAARLLEGDFFYDH